MLVLMPTPMPMLVLMPDADAAGKVPSVMARATAFHGRNPPTNRK